MVRNQRFLSRLLILVLTFLFSACGHPAERALQGRWNGQSVENFDKEAIAGATGWARGTSFEFNGSHLKVTVPAETPREGVYEIVAIEDRTLTLSILDAAGKQSQLELIVDDAESLRWVLDEGRTLVMNHQKL